MRLFKSTAGVGCIELHTDGDRYWFMERWRIDARWMARSKNTFGPYEAVSLVVRKRWFEWGDRPWLAPMVEFMVGRFGEGLFAMVALEDM